MSRTITSLVAAGLVVLGIAVGQAVAGADVSQATRDRLVLEGARYCEARATATNTAQSAEEFRACIDDYVSSKLD